jgi:hypothetical protein
MYATFLGSALPLASRDWGKLSEVKVEEYDI